MGNFNALISRVFSVTSPSRFLERHSCSTLWCGYKYISLQIQFYIHYKLIVATNMFISLGSISHLSWPIHQFTKSQDKSSLLDMTIPKLFLKPTRQLLAWPDEFTSWLFSSLG